MKCLCKSIEDKSKISKLIIYIYIYIAACHLLCWAEIKEIVDNFFANLSEADNLYWVQFLSDYKDLNELFHDDEVFVFKSVAEESPYTAD